MIEKDQSKALITTDLVVTNDSVRKLIYTPDIFAIELSLHGEKRMAVLKDIQFHPVKDTILHIDLLEVNDKKPVVIEVPVQLEGHAEGVKADGKLTLSMKKIKVKATYDKIPERVVVNVDSLGLGKTIQIGDLHFEGPRTDQRQERCRMRRTADPCRPWRRRSCCRRRKVIP